MNNEPANEESRWFNEPSFETASLSTSSSPASKARVSSKKTTRGSEDGDRHLLNSLYSKHFNSILFSTEETSLQFHPNFIVATVTCRLYCFPKKRQVNIIHRSKITDVSFTLGPRSIPKIICLLIAASATLIFFGVVLGGCKLCNSDEVVNDTFGIHFNCFVGSCPLLTTGILILMIPVPLLTLLPCFWNWHHVYLDVGGNTHAFRFNKKSFSRNTDDEATSDEFYFADYVYNRSAVTKEAIIFTVAIDAGGIPLKLATSNIHQDCSRGPEEA